MTKFYGAFTLLAPSIFETCATRITLIILETPYPNNDSGYVSANKRCVHNSYGYPWSSGFEQARDRIHVLAPEDIFRGRPLLVDLPMQDKFHTQRPYQSYAQLWACWCLSLGANLRN